MEQTEEEEEWYEKAFGALQNIMNVRIMYAPMNELMKKGKQFDLFARFKF